MRTYTAGKGRGDGQEHPDSREWVFGLLATPRYRRRMEQLEALDLRRRTGCEPCLRALVTDRWTPDALHHLGWCDSCRAAAAALGLQAPAGASFLRRRAGWLAVAAFAVVAVPLVGSQVVNQGSHVGVRGGGAASTAGSSGATTSGTTTPATTTPPATTGTVTPVPRSRPSAAVAKTHGGGAKKALPLTT